MMRERQALTFPGDRLRVLSLRQRWAEKPLEEMLNKLLIGLVGPLGVKEHPAEPPHASPWL